MAQGAIARRSVRCDQRHVLENVYKVTTQHYSQAVDLLAQEDGAKTREDYGVLRNLVDDARTRSEQARTALLTHIEEHGC